jgi:hypothetical protein
LIPLLPGSAFLFDIEARPGDCISFVSMFGQSNDLFIASGPEGVALFDSDGTPRVGDISVELSMWDLGTEINEYPGAGPNQEGVEQCDDANDVVTDVCPACMDAVCGDGFKYVGVEECDDDDMIDDDNCTNSCISLGLTVGVEALNGACVTTNGNVVDAAVQVLIDRGHDVYEINAASIDTLQELSQFDVIVPTSAGANCYQVDWSQGRRVGGGQL